MDFRTVAKSDIAHRGSYSSVPLKSIVWGYGADLSAQRAAFTKGTMNAPL